MAENNYWLEMDNASVFETAIGALGVLGFLVEAEALGRIKVEYENSVPGSWYEDTHSWAKASLDAAEAEISNLRKGRVA